MSVPLMLGRRDTPTMHNGAYIAITTLVVHIWMELEVRAWYTGTGVIC